MVGNGLCKSAKEVNSDMKTKRFTAEITTEFPDATTVLLQVRELLTAGMLKPVDLTIQAGQLWMLSGVSGIGKSQLLKAIADLIPHSGQAWLNGKAQTDVCADQWRQQVMYFSAETAWWTERVAEHFETLPTAEQLQALGLNESFLQKNPESLSSGEKQRLALLRGLQYQPKVLLLDEITANLDEASTLQVEEFLQQYIQEPSVVAAHPGSQQPHNEDSARAILWISHDTHQCQRLSPPELQLVLNK
jgi:ABC-type iron transport system FetAB ATPase subunit